MQYQIGKRQFEAESPALTLQLKASNDVIESPASLRQRLEDDGYLFIRGFHDPAKVLAARKDILMRLQERGQLQPDSVLMDGIAKEGVKTTASVRGQEDLITDALRDLLYSERAHAFFARLFDTPAQAYQFQWLRAAGPGAGSPIHADLPYMGRGSQRLVTLWTPLGRITPDMGPLAVCLRSHTWPQVRDKYAHSDVDRERHGGVFTEDSGELIERFGGQWATTTFEPGDAVIMGMYTLHGSLANGSNKFRLSCDTRYQPANEPMDERWRGAKPSGHEVLWAAEPKLRSVAEARAHWGL
ncbi:MAG: phytanoyl-CoA dioxygenase family protein [Variovorax sp.]